VPVRRPRDRAGERRVLDLRSDEDKLARGDVRPDSDRELGVPLEAGVRVHGRGGYRGLSDGIENLGA
jgi:hypothetical protein